MVQAIINIDDQANRILNIVKAKFGLKDKSEAINMVALQYEQEILEPELRPEYLKKLQKIKAEKGVSFRSVAELRKSIEHARIRNKA